MNITIDAEAAEAPFEQVRRQIRDAARDGALAAGSKLPTVRALAEQLGLAVNTVARAYRELESDGIIETRGRSGSFVAFSADAAERALQQAAADYAARARTLGADPSAALAAARAALDA
ncbi:GntR family transcriptional regulator [uncultured Schumannella sp.]|uniref:GntR family transcriptional regulator n=1 Tax=uncultured Schumannella sp. TaxID=1195956 RepID=UPI0025FD2C69|nr:GntR family transcriptional regulator [uncultured Schumannella sp.]